MNKSTGLMAIAIAMLFLSFPTWKTNAEERKEGGLHAFFLEYAIVSELKAQDGAQLKSLLAFLDKNPKAADSLAEFWWSWALRQCLPYLKENIECVAKIKEKADREKEFDNVKEQRNRCVDAFIFEHWNDINESAVNKAAHFANDESPVARPNQDRR